jgi:WD40 repeat protein
LHTGGITNSPDGHLFAHESLNPGDILDRDHRTIVWRNWVDLSVARTITLPQVQAEIKSLACSPDGRWLVIGPGYPERLFLLDWQTGEVMSHHAIAGCITTGLTFDPTSTFVAGFACHDNWGHCIVFRLDLAERALVRPQGEEWWTRDEPPDQISGRMALSVVHWELDRTGLEWRYRDLADTHCQAAFSPDSRIVIFNPMNSGYSGFGLELVAYEVVSGKRLWCARRKEENQGPFIFAPDGSVLLVPMQGGEVLVYRVEDGTLMQHLPLNLDEPVQALAFDHDGTTLWLATEESLVQYQPRG